MSSMALVTGSRPSAANRSRPCQLRRGQARRADDRRDGIVGVDAQLARGGVVGGYRDRVVRGERGQERRHEMGIDELDRPGLLEGLIVMAWFVRALEVEKGNVGARAEHLVHSAFEVGGLGSPGAGLE